MEDKLLREKMFIETFKKINSDLNISTINITFSGTTLVVVLLIDDLLICSNVGDSRAIIGSFSGTSTWNINAVSHDHKPDLPEEYARIIRSNGRVEPCLDYNGNFVGPKRVWKMEEGIPGLAMSRSLGDVAASDIGVICTPEVLEQRMGRNDKILVMASDGVWEFFDNSKVMQIVGKYWKDGNSKEAADELVKEARNAWELTEEPDIDDITVIVVFFA